MQLSIFLASIISLIIPALSKQVVSIGFAASLDAGRDRCGDDWQFLVVAEKALDVLRRASWFQNSGINIFLEYIPAHDVYTSFLSAAEFSQASPRADVKRVAIVQTGRSEEVRSVQLVSKRWSLPLLSNTATATTLTAATGERSTGGDTALFFRLPPSDDVTAGALWTFISNQGWSTLSVLHVRGELGDGSADALQQAVLLDTVQSKSSEPVQFENIISFRSDSVADIETGLEVLMEGTARLIVLFANSQDAGIVLHHARQMSMTGKGWTWLGSEWVRESTWSNAHPVASHERRLATAATNTTAASALDAETEALRTSIQQAMQGAVGVVLSPPKPVDIFATDGLQRISLSTVQAKRHEEYFLQGAGAMPMPLFTKKACPELYEYPLSDASVGIALDGYAAYVFDAVWGVAVASVSTWERADRDAALETGRKFTSADIAARLAVGGVTRLSPMTGRELHWLDNGDTEGYALSLVNVQGTELVEVGTWVSDVRRAAPRAAEGVIANGRRAWSGSWSMIEGRPIVWSSMRSLIPPDRANKTENSSSIAWLVGLLGIVISLAVGALLHQAGVQWLPESAATVMIGLVLGLLIRLLAADEVQATAGFNVETFMLVLLPIIIFESGYALERAPFFTQLFSISFLAVGGTLISALVIGGVLFYAGRRGTVIALSWEECMSFASLLSATDPVATLAVFSSLRVDPTLNSLVYGESVLNDAVGLALYAAFTGFLVNDVTGERAAFAVGNFVALLTVSVLVGVVVSLLATLVFRILYVPKLYRKKGAAENEHDEDGEHSISGIGEAALLLVFCYVSFAGAEALHLSGIVSALFAGITMAAYTRKIMTLEGRRMSSTMFKMLAQLADTAVFLQIGLNVVLLWGKGKYDSAFIAVTLIACLVGRALNIFPLSFLLNLGRKSKIPLNMQIQMWQSGLRGAIAFATALNFPSQHRLLIINATSWICMFTIFAMGTTTTSSLKALKIPFGEDVADHKTAQVAAFADAVATSSVKRAMTRVDGWVRRIVYGPVLLGWVEALEAEQGGRNVESNATISSIAKKKRRDSTGATTGSPLAGDHPVTILSPSPRLPSSPVPDDTTATTEIERQLGTKSGNPSAGEGMHVRLVLYAPDELQVADEEVMPVSRGTNGPSKNRSVDASEW